MSLLDQILESPKIVSTEHNTGNIHVELPDFDGNLQKEIDRINGDGWDEREYGITREAAVAKLKAANTPEAREKAVRELRSLALRRASLDTSNGKVAVMVAGQAAWHRLGVRIDKACNSAQARQFSSTDWRVNKVPLTYDYNGQSMTAPDVFGIVREDTGTMLGHVGSRYAPIQNADATDFLDDVLVEFSARYETAGAINGGRQVWYLVHLPQQRFAVNGVDVVEPYALFTNTHDGTGSGKCFATTERVVCANTHRIACERGRGKGLSIRHTGNVREKISDARAALGLTIKGISEFQRQAEQLAHKPLAINHYANDVLDAVLDVTAADCLAGADALAAAVVKTSANLELERKSFARKIERRGEILADILERYESERCGIGGIRGTAWAAYNAVSEHADHNRIGNQSRDQETWNARRFESVIYGDADDLKQSALQIALRA